jgi:hypothetical protein
MKIAGTPEGVVHAARTGAASVEEIRCPSCARLLVLRSGPAIRPHFAHRPRQSCRNRPGSAPVTPLRVEQLTLFDLPPVLAAPGDPLVILESGFVYPLAEPAGLTPAEVAARKRRRRRRRAWLPRLIRRLKARATGAGDLRGPASSSAFTPETRGDAGPRA